MTDRVYLPTEIGVVGQGSPAGIDDENPPKVKEVKPNEDPAGDKQPEIYKNKPKADAGTTLKNAEEANKKKASETKASDTKSK